MSADRLLQTLLRSLQTHADQQDTPRLLSTAASLLISLHNPLNITVLTSNLLTAPAIWHRPDGLQTCLRVIGVFNSAALAILKREEQDAMDASQHWYAPPAQSILKGPWIKAVVKGALGGPDGSGQYSAPAWKAMLAIAGLLLGFGPLQDESIDIVTRQSLEEELINAVNKGLQQLRAGEEDLSGPAIALTLNHTFPLISHFHRTLLNYDVSRALLAFPQSL